MLDLLFKGISLRKIADHIKQFYGVNVHHTTILRWIRKYIKLMKECVKDLIPHTTNKIWHVDEMMVNINGEYRWLWNLMDSDTRFLLAMQISKRREIEDARKVFQEAKEKAQAKPETIVTDGLRAYEDAVRKEFFTLRKPRTKHVRLASVKDHPNNNLIERFHGTVRERDKVMRALDNEESAKDFIEGFKIYYNFIRPHMGLNGLTPAEKAKIDLNLNKGNRWLSMITKSIRKSCKDSIQ